MKKSTAIYNTKPPDMSMLRIKFSGFKNSIYILPQDQAEKLLKKEYKQKIDYVKLS
jgi:hypothetical protein